MTIRGTIILLTLPLFLALALVNAALLYFQEKTEIDLALRKQAEAAAVTTAEFIAGMEAPATTLAQPHRARALAAAARRLPGLNALYLVAAGSPPQALIPTVHPLDPASLHRPAQAEIRPIAGAPGDRHVVALAPAGPGAFVAARIDAEPLMQRLVASQRRGLAIVLAAGLIALALAWLVARRITGELDASAAAIADGNAPARSLGIREAKDLADAVRLMRANDAAAESRDRLALARGDAQRTVTSAFTAWRQAEFAPIAASLAGRSIALRIMGDAPLGSFFAFSQTAEQALIVIGRCDAASPGDALANALAARRFLEANLPAIPPEECLGLARRAYGIAALQTIAWDAAAPGTPVHSFAWLADAASAPAIIAYVDRNPDASPTELLDGLAVLLAPVGIFAAVAPA